MVIIGFGTRIRQNVRSLHPQGFAVCFDSIVNVSGYVAEAVARQLRHQLLGVDLQHHQEERGEFTEEELTEARAMISGAADPGGSASMR